jgi:hypothetical protein
MIPVTFLVSKLFVGKVTKGNEQFHFFISFFIIYFCLAPVFSSFLLLFSINGKTKPRPKFRTREQAKLSYDQENNQNHHMTATTKTAMNQLLFIENCIILLKGLFSVHQGLEQILSLSEIIMELNDTSSIIFHVCFHICFQTTGRASLCCN